MTYYYMSVVYVEKNKTVQTNVIKNGQSLKKFLPIILLFDK